MAQTQCHDHDVVVINNNKHHGSKPTLGILLAKSTTATPNLSAQENGLSLFKHNSILQIPRHYHCQYTIACYAKHIAILVQGVASVLQPKTHCITSRKLSGQAATTTGSCPCPGSSPRPGIGTPFRELGVTSRTPFLSTTCKDAQ